MPSDLAIDTAARRLDEPGLYEASLPDAWSYALPSGGVLMTVALRAIVAEIADPAFRPISANTVFCSPVPPGPVRIRVEILRRGNAAIQARAALRLASGELALEVSATFARDRRGLELASATPPVVPPPEEAPPFTERPRFARDVTFSFFENFETRLALGAPWWEAGPGPGDGRLARWHRYLAPQRLADGTLDPLALPPLADTMPPAVAHRAGPEAPLFHAPSLDLTVHFLAPTSRAWLLVSTRAHHARAGYASAEAEIWDDEGRLVAYATQAMILRELAT